MKRLDYSISLRGFFLVVIALNLSLQSFAQQFASVSLDNATGFHHPPQMQIPANDGTVTLKEALEVIKDQYNVKFAYRVGLLDGKRVSQNLLNNQESLEVLLKKILSS